MNADSVGGAVVAAAAGLRERMQFVRPRPPWPPRPLIDLAAGRDPGHVELTPELLEAAFEHRMGGLLWSHVKDRVPDGDLKTRLAVHDLRTRPI